MPMAMLTKVSRTRLPTCVKASPAFAQSGSPLPCQAPLSISANVNATKKSEGMKLTTLK